MNKPKWYEKGINIKFKIIYIIKIIYNKDI